MQSLDLNDLRQIGDEPRVLDLRLAERLGFTQPSTIRQLIRRKEEQLSRRGEVFSAVLKTSDLGGRPGNEYWLTKWQAIKICMWSEAPNADAVQDEIADVFEAYTDGKLVPRGQSPVTTDMFGQLFAVAKDIASNVVQLVVGQKRLEDGQEIIKGGNARIERRMGDVIPRYEPSEKNKRIYLHVVKIGGGYCPCGCRQKLLDDNGNILSRENGNPVLEYDHMFSRERNGLAAMWPLHYTCNVKVKDEDYRDSKRSRFSVFQEDVKHFQPEVRDPPKSKPKDDDVGQALFPFIKD